MSSLLGSASLVIAQATPPFPVWLLAMLIILAALLVAAVVLTGLRYIPNNRVGIVEKLWSAKGSVPEGRIIALDGEAGLQAEVLRGGVHFGLWLWQYKIIKVGLVTVPQGKIGYVYARDGSPLSPSQTLAKVVPCNNFQDARGFLVGVAANENEDVVLRGERGRQRAFLREGVYALNLALFVVLTEDQVFYHDHQGRRDLVTLTGWQNELKQIDGFDPVVVGQPIQAPDPVIHDKMTMIDTLGIVTVHDGPTLPPGEIIAPAVGTERNDKNFHNNYQDPEAFLRAGGHRGRQLVPLTDGTYFINRWFATVEMVPKTVVPIGYVGVIVSYFGKIGQDVSGVSFRHGERVAEGERGVLERPLQPGKYAFNSYAGNIILVPTTNFVLHWVTGKSEGHRYDESLRSIDLVTRDAYEPMLPLSVVVHIDYLKAPSVIQRFGDVKKLITQTLDPMLSAYFRDVAHKKTMLQLLQERDDIQQLGRTALHDKFQSFDIECVDVLIGKPDTAEAGGKIETLLEQLRMRQLSIEQMETYERQREAATKLQTLNEAQAQATMQTQLTNSKVQIQIVENQGQADLAKATKAAEAELARARKQAEQMVVMAEAELSRSRKNAEQVVVTAQADAEQRTLAGKGEAARLAQIGLSEASVLFKKIQSFSDPRVYALTQIVEQLVESKQPLVPQRVFMAGSNGNGSPGDPLRPDASQGVLGLLLNLLVAEKTGFSPNGVAGDSDLEQYAARLAHEATATAPTTPPEPIKLEVASKPETAGKPETANSKGRAKSTS